MTDPTDWIVNLKIAGAQLDAFEEKWARVGERLTTDGTKLTAVVTLPIVGVVTLADALVAEDLPGSWDGAREWARDASWRCRSCDGVVADRR